MKKSHVPFDKFCSTDLNTPAKRRVHQAHLLRNARNQRKDKVQSICGMSIAAVMALVFFVLCCVPY